MWNADIWIAVGIGALTILLAYMGVHVTLTPPAENKKWIWRAAFSAVGILTCALIAIQTYRNVQAQSSLGSQLGDKLNKIQQNTSNPPVINFNPTIEVPTAPQHTHVVYTPIKALETSLNAAPLTLKVGETPEIAIGFQNIGDFAVDWTQSWLAFMPVDTKKINTVFDKVRSKMKYDHIGSSLPAHTPDGAFNSVHLEPKITQDVLSGFLTGNEAFCALGSTRWKDASGIYETDYGECAIMEPGG